MGSRSGFARISVVATAALAAWLSWSAPADAFEVLDGRLTAHGFVETQVRALNADYSEDWDVSQWYTILNLEIEVDVAPDGFGFVDLLQAYTRFEVRYDCIYSRGCGMVRSIDVYGDRPKSLPRRLSNAHDQRFAGAIDLHAAPRRSGGTTDPVPLADVAGFNILTRLTGADGIAGTPPPPLVPDDPFPIVFQRFDDYRFTQIDSRGGRNAGRPTLRFGPWRPADFIQPIATLAEVANPFDSTRASPVLQAATYNTTLLGPDRTLGTVDDGTVPEAEAAAEAARGAGARPFRPIPLANEGRNGQADTVARGLYIPSKGLSETIEGGDLGTLPLNFRESERAWNRGASQQDEKELKEAYLDIEMFDSRLWLRLGKQSIVWGKTELFRTTDQFNPQDLALASLPSLEESRIALWAFRAVWSFYEVGEISDVRLEAAFNFDQFESADLGACGEPYTVNLVCQGSFGAFSHGLTGIGVVGIEFPESPWNSLEGWEVGARLEFRWDRFSFAISDYYGFDDLPHPVRISTFERNVDPETGRPRIVGARGACLTGTESDCLQPGPTDRADPSPRDDPRNALDAHHANQQVFAMVCSTTIGVTELDLTACAQNALGSQTVPLVGFTISQLGSATLAGSPQANAAQASFSGALLPLVRLSADANDLSNGGTSCTDDIWSSNPLSGGPPTPTCGSGGAGPFVGLGEALGLFLTPEQEALLGCGPFWGVNCDDSGIDLLNTEASILVQSFVGFDGTTQGWRTDTAVPQPGTAGFRGSPLCTTGQIGGPRNPNRRLPGCRGLNPDGVTFQKGFSVDQDGDPRLVEPHPFTGQTWQNELAGVSWNFMMLTVSQDPDFKPKNTMRAGKCGFVTPQECFNVREIFNLIGLQRNTARAGGDGTFGRRTFTWHSGGEIVLRFEKRNVLGFAMDFAEDNTKANVNLEATWIEGVPRINNNRFDGLTKTDEYNLTVSVDRPTFINFLNPGRTFFINTQWFIQYIDGYQKGMGANGPWNFLGTLSFQTGYWQDRLLPQLTFVYDVQSVSGAALAEVQFRYTSTFSVAVGVATFMGREQLVDMPVNPIAPADNRQGKHAYKDSAQNGLAVLRDRDEVYLRVRYTF